MLNVKLNRPIPGPQASQASYHSKIVCANAVDIFTHRGGELKEIVTRDKDGNSEAFYVANLEKGRPAGFADEIDFWDHAYIMNERGSTTVVVESQ